MGRLGIATKIADQAGVPPEITGAITNPIGTVGNALGLSPNVIEAIKFGVNPTGYAVGFAKDKALEAMRNAPNVPGGGEEGGRGEGSSVGQDFNLRRRSFDDEDGFKRGGKVKSKPKFSSASKRADGIAQRGKTKGRYI